MEHSGTTHGHLSSRRMTMSRPLALWLDDPRDDSHRTDECQRARREKRRPHGEGVVRLPEAARALADTRYVRIDADRAVEGIERAEEWEHGPGRAGRDDAGDPGCGERRRQPDRRPHPLVAERSLAVLE